MCLFLIKWPLSFDRGQPSALCNKVCRHSSKQPSTIIIKSIYSILYNHNSFRSFYESRWKVSFFSSLQVLKEILAMLQQILYFCISSSTAVLSLQHSWYCATYTQLLAGFPGRFLFFWLPGDLSFRKSKRGSKRHWNERKYTLLHLIKLYILKRCNEKID